MAAQVSEETCMRCAVLLKEIAIKNTIISDLQEKISKKEWTKGI